MKALWQRVCVIAVVMCDRGFALEPDLRPQPSIWRGAPVFIKHAVENDARLSCASRILYSLVESACFKAGIVGAAGIVLYLLCNFWTNRRTERLRALLEARLDERERMVREANDTLLQSFQGLVLQFQAAAEQVQPSSALRKPIEDALDIAEKVLSDGRDRVMDLADHADAVNISQSLLNTGRRLVAYSKARFRIVIEGKPRQLDPIVATEILWIADEAVSNAVQHANAESIELRMAYRARKITISICDDGIGMESPIMVRGVQKKYCGLIGMRDHAKKIKGIFVITSRLAFGTQVDLSVPSSIAYSRSSRHCSG
jgi:signal transduction histidine kinase